MSKVSWPGSSVECLMFLGPGPGLSVQCPMCIGLGPGLSVQGFLAWVQGCVSKVSCSGLSAGDGGWQEGGGGGGTDS